MENGTFHLEINILKRGLTQEQRIKIGVARCARVSYLNFTTGISSHHKDYKVHDDLFRSGHMCYDDKTEIATSYRLEKMVRSNFK